MDSKQYKHTAGSDHVLHEDAAAYESLDIARRKEAILATDTEKFMLFTKLVRINRMLKNAKVTHKKMIE